MRMKRTRGSLVYDQVFPASVIFYVLTHYTLILALGYGPSPLDEAAAALLSGLAFMYLRSRFDQTFFLFLVYEICLLIGAAQTHYGGVEQPLAAIQAALLDLKLPIFIYASYFAFARIQNISRVFYSVFLVFIIIAIANLPFAFLDELRGVSFDGNPLNFKGIAGQATGLCRHPTELAWLNCIAVFSSLCLYLRRRSNKYLILAVLFALVVLMAASIKEIAALLIGSTIVLRGSGSSFIRFMILSMTTIVTALLAFLLTDFGDSLLAHAGLFVGDNAISTVRAAMVDAATQIVYDNFPFGTGGGTFGSAPSYTLGYSEVYYAYGIDLLDGGSPENRAFLMDAMWSKILGESGAIGAFCYIVFLFILNYRLVRRRRIAATLDRAFVDFCLAIQIFVFLVSLASSPYTNELLCIMVGFTLGFAGSSTELTRTAISLRTKDMKKRREVFLLPS